MTHATFLDGGEDQLPRLSDFSKAAAGIINTFALARNDFVGDLKQPAL
jgi:hypothetical protein